MLPIIKSEIFLVHSQKHNGNYSSQVLKLGLIMNVDSCSTKVLVAFVRESKKIR